MYHMLINTSQPLIVGQEWRHGSLTSEPGFPITLMCVLSSIPRFPLTTCLFFIFPDSSYSFPSPSPFSPLPTQIGKF